MTTATTKATITYVDFAEDKGVNIGVLAAGKVEGKDAPDNFESLAYVALPALRNAAKAVIEGTLSDPAVTVHGIAGGMLMPTPFGIQIPEKQIDSMDLSLYSDRFTYESDSEDAKYPKRILAIGQTEDKVFFGDNAVDAIETFKEHAAAEDQSDKMASGLIVPRELLQELVNVLDSIIKDKNIQ